MEIIKLDNNNFDEITLTKNKIVLVDFYADWCGPCKMMGLVLEEFISGTDKNVIVGKLNVDEQEKIANQFNVYSIPTLAIFKDGKFIKTVVGYKSLDELNELVNV